MVIRRIGVLSLGKVLGLVYGAFGLLVAAVYNVIARTVGGLELEVE